MQAEPLQGRRLPSQLRPARTCGVEGLSRPWAHRPTLWCSHTSQAPKKKVAAPPAALRKAAKVVAPTNPLYEKRPKTYGEEGVDGRRWRLLAGHRLGRRHCSPPAGARSSLCSSLPPVAPADAPPLETAGCRHWRCSAAQAGPAPLCALAQVRAAAASAPRAQPAAEGGRLRSRPEADRIAAMDRSRLREAGL